MAPTETLAEQHHRTLDRLLGGTLPVELLTGSTSAARRRELLDRLASGQLQLVVGTHALIEPAVEFRDLAVVVVDEQHRFGVRQRAALDAKAPDGLVPHALHMTATPIPRTLVADRLRRPRRDRPARAPGGPPAGRDARGRRRARAGARVRADPRGDRARGGSASSSARSSRSRRRSRRRRRPPRSSGCAATEFADQRVELIHGQMPSKQKRTRWRAFAAGDADVLVATSVIEVGIDVPNATVMLIEAAERYGISQLHQLRGRIGRGEHASLCILFGDPTLPRLEAIANERDGFRLAEIDLELRGAGEVLGTRQHGLPEFKVARLPEDVELLERARDRAEEILRRGPAARAARARAAARGRRGALRVRARPDPGMSGILRLLERGYTMMWREDRVEEALIGLGDEFEWVVPRHPEGGVRRGADGVIQFFREWVEPWEDFQPRLGAPAGRRRPRTRDHPNARRGTRERRPGRDDLRAALDLPGRALCPNGHVLRRRRGAPRGGARDAVRVVAGEFKGRRLHTARGSRTRPTADRVREALFSMLGDVSGARVLDLFAGSGALGIEALSRGAESRRVRRARPRARSPRCAATWRLSASTREVARAGCRCVSSPRAGRRHSTSCSATRHMMLRPSGRAARRAPAGDARRRDARIVTESDKRNPLLLPLPAPRRARVRRHARSRSMAAERNGGTAVCPGSYDPITIGSPRHHRPRGERVRQRRSWAW